MPSPTKLPVPWPTRLTVQPTPQPSLRPTPTDTVTVSVTLSLSTDSGTLSSMQEANLKTSFAIASNVPLNAITEFGVTITAAPSRRYGRRLLSMYTWTVAATIVESASSSSSAADGESFAQALASGLEDNFAEEVLNNVGVSVSVETVVASVVPRPTDGPSVSLTTSEESSSSSVEAESAASKETSSSSPPAVTAETGVVGAGLVVLFVGIGFFCMRAQKSDKEGSVRRKSAEVHLSELGSRRGSAFEFSGGSKHKRGSRLLEKHRKMQVEMLALSGVQPNISIDATAEELHSVQLDESMTTASTGHAEDFQAPKRSSKTLLRDMFKSGPSESLSSQLEKGVTNPFDEENSKKWAGPKHKIFGGYPGGSGMKGEML